MNVIDETRAIDWNNHGQVLDVASTFDPQSNTCVPVLLGGVALVRFAQFALTHPHGFKPEGDIGRRAADVAVRLRIKELENEVETLRATTNLQAALLNRDRRQANHFIGFPDRRAGSVG